METAARQPLLKVEHLKQYFKVNKSFTVKAVDDISFEIFPGETYGLVGGIRLGQIHHGAQRHPPVRPNRRHHHFQWGRISPAK